MTERRENRRHHEAPSRVALSKCTAGVATLFFLLSWGVSGSVGMPRGPPTHLQDPASVSGSEEWSISELAELLANAEPQERERKLANLVEWMNQLRQLQQQDEAMAAAIETEVAGNARMAVPPPLAHGARTHPGHAAAAGVAGEDEGNGDEDGKGKRGSFMSLCHFKICNMGRKRNLRYNPWTRV